MKIKWRQWKIIMTAVLGALLLTGCGLLSKENVKLRDLDFTVLSEEKIPEELKTVIAEKGGISKLEYWLSELNFPDYQQQIKFLRNLQELRSTGSVIEPLY